MEKERFFPVPEMNCDPCFLNLNWDQSMEQQSSHFESALSSMVSSPTTNPPPSAASTAAESAVFGELIGRLGSICNSGEISPQTQHYLSGGNTSTTTSCYTTPLSSPPKLNLSTHGSSNLPISGNLVLPPSMLHLAPFSMDPGFTERAARFSCFGRGNYGGGPQMDLQEAPMQDGSQLVMEMRDKFGSKRSLPIEESSLSDHPAAGGRTATRKRKAVQKGRTKDSPTASVTNNLPNAVEVENSRAKRTKCLEMDGSNGIKPKLEQSESATSGNGGKPEEEKNSKLPEPPPKQDYIHVRARRGQATDSHSLAERVRREKISERMKFLQDLVPGCDKVTGKAVMLDEIINYVQSLQRQVEFLSMKLATVNPRIDFNIENLLNKDMHQSHGSSHLPSLKDNFASGFPFAPQPPQNASSIHSITTGDLENNCVVDPLCSNIRRPASAQLPATLDGFGNLSSQVGGFCDDDLQNVVQMGFSQNQESMFSSSAFHGALLPIAHMKIEL